MEKSNDNIEAQSIGTRVRKTIGDFKIQIAGLSCKAKLGLLTELDTMVTEIRTEVQSKKNAIVSEIRTEVQNKHNNGKVANPDDELSQEHKANGVRVRKTMEELKGLPIEDKEVFLSEIEAMVIEIRSEVQNKKNNG